MADLIERSAALDAIENLHIPEDMCVFEILSHIELAIGTLPSAQPEQRWIPWYSGELPKESGQYIVTAYDGNVSRVTFAKYQKRLKRWELTGARAYWRVLAWCPLPEPWKGENHEAE